jgi:polysaccharide export outer membrane protein
VSRMTLIRLALGVNLALLVGFGASAQPTAPASSPKPAAAAPAPAPAVAAPMASGDHSYQLGFGDVVEVSVIGRPDFDHVHSRIGSDGTVLLPLIGAVPASGRTPAQLSEDIRTTLVKGGFYANPLVRVDVATVASRYVTVLGYVGTPGLIALDRDYHLSEMIARVGGRSASGADYVQLTHEDGSSTRYSISELATGGRDKDPVISAGDKLFVPAAENEVFYLQGSVKAPGAFPITNGMTVRMALARAGGVGDNGSDKKIKLVRKGVEVKPVDLDKTILQAGDIVTVGARLF